MDTGQRSVVRGAAVLILRACVRCGQLSDRTLCPSHRKETRASSTARGYDRKWRKTRDAYIHAYPWCSEPDCREMATDVDHIDGLGPKGQYGHDWSNLRSYCHSCHSKRTARDQGPGSKARGRTWKDSIVVLIGESGSGKSSVRKELAPRIGYTSLGPDDFMGRWDTLLVRLDAVPHAVVECVRPHTGLKARMKSRRTTVVRLSAPKPTLIDRMVDRGDDRHTAAEWLSQQGGTQLRADLEIDTTSGTPAEIAKQIESHLAL